MRGWVGVLWLVAASGFCGGRGTCSRASSPPAAAFGFVQTASPCARKLERRRTCLYGGAAERWRQNLEEELRRRNLSTESTESSAQGRSGAASARGNQSGTTGKSRYVPPEQWNHTIDMSYENRVRFDAQQNGNRWRQNEILRQSIQREGGG
uniref:Uncharacterized protein n=1 Tax=Rhizochromulina marina TaxID=1034831 RepID=A0A7S2STM2_9STRA|mmetsp:Transcript_6390/g.18717  ORF Transcript_6390/g.18717 Transcript_6390/m.18717 type:complete len:152 (+) Transcript_6390:156-611(+)|eukprot:CAMPEP_0118986256 /NCGR_PEP_ID=MMETSP1173-20130426/41741_1 /TAXON_ID=1034831 /ORGANISM="Rhizochromulina marina cf, Strain CCMP1243" /LENGTH=151 /DNA_ID=CAMNT_0006937031 /DNA_START=88 /DNA_END=543 /DNA_ORIENTATION=+